MNRSSTQANRNVPVPMYFSSSSSTNHFHAARKSAAGLAAGAADDAARVNPHDPFDQLPGDVRQLLLPGLRIAEIVEPEDFAQRVAALHGIGERKVIERQMRDERPIAAAAGRGAQRRGRRFQAADALPAAPPLPTRNKAVRRHAAIGSARSRLVQVVRTTSVSSAGNCG